MMINLLCNINTLNILNSFMGGGRGGYIIALLCSAIRNTLNNNKS